MHSDHDSGLIRKILEGAIAARSRLLLLHRLTHNSGERIEVYTTRTVCEAYVRKVNAILGSNNFADYFTFRPVPIGQVMSTFRALCAHTPPPSHASVLHHL